MSEPDDDPLQHTLLRESREKGLEEGLEKGLEKGQIEGCRTMVLAILTGRGIDLSPNLLADLTESLLASRRPARIVEAALGCRSAADFLGRLRGGGEASPKGEA